MAVIADCLGREIEVTTKDDRFQQFVDAVCDSIVKVFTRDSGIPANMIFPEFNRGGGRNDNIFQL